MLWQNESRWSCISGSVHFYTSLLYTPRYGPSHLWSGPAKVFGLYVGTVIKYCWNTREINNWFSPSSYILNFRNNFFPLSMKLLPISQHRGTPWLLLGRIRGLSGLTQRGEQGCCFQGPGNCFSSLRFMELYMFNIYSGRKEKEKMVVWEMR